MKTISTKIPDELEARLKAAAGRQRRSRSELIRTALEAYLDHEKPEPPSGSVYELARDLAGSLDSGICDLGHNKKHMEAYGR